MQVQRKPNSFKLRSVRSLERSDLAFLQQKSARPTIKNLRDSHHIVARLLASGMSYTEIARESGRSISNVSLLASSPAMQELVASYRADEDQSWRESRDEFYGLIHNNGLKAARQISDQLDEADDEGASRIPINRLLAIVSDTSDRVGYNKKSTTMNINVDFAKRLEDARRRSIEVLTAPVGEAAE